MQLRNRKRMFIEEAEPSDISSVSQIHIKSFKRGWSDGEFERFLVQDHYWCMVARQPRLVRKKITGFILVKQIANEAEIITVATLPNSRRRGIGEQILSETIRRLKADRVHSLLLDVEETNTGAIGLYRKFGFEEINRRESYYSSSDEEAVKNAAIVMRLDLLN
ncbi:MAG: ribosomal protein S18-alanine N-acetyltransferase [Pseudomonadota bacterium]